MKTLKKFTSRLDVTKHNDDHPQGSTTPTHDDRSSPMNVLMLSVGEAEKVLDDLHILGLTAAVGGLLEALKSIKVRSQYIHFYSCIM